MFTLTDDQRNASQLFKQFIQSDEPYMVISGHSGVGKTYLVNHLLEEYTGHVVITAPTHKALSVLIDKTNSEHYQDARTIHSLLNLRIKKQNHKEVLFKDEFAPSKMPESGLIVVDEISMCGKDLMDYITDEQVYGVKFLFVGDPLQLPPVGESMSPSFELPEFKANLTEVVRQAMDNPIIALTVDIRKAIREKDEDVISFDTVTTDNGSGVVVYNKLKSFKQAVFDSVNRNPNTIDEYKVIAWRNKVVTNFNDLIRKNIYGAEPEEDFLVDEAVVINDSIVMNTIDGQVIVPRDSEGIITAVEKVKVDRFNMVTRETLDAYKLTILLPSKGDLEIEAVALNSVSKQIFDRAVRNLASNKNWDTFWSLKGAFKDVRHIHSITSHKSQGSTYTESFIDADDILTNPNKEEALKCLYVAVSRASEVAHILYR